MDDTRRYARQSAVTDPGERRPALQGLPSAEPSRLRELVTGLVIHAGMGDLYGVNLSGRVGEARLRTLRGMLDRLLELGPETLERPRPPERRLVGNCRASTVLACGLLREAGVPARARCGFSAYFTSPILGDHWVVEYWSAERPGWRLMDAELDELLMATTTSCSTRTRCRGAASCSPARPGSGSGGEPMTLPGSDSTPR